MRAALLALALSACASTRAPLDPYELELEAALGRAAAERPLVEVAVGVLREGGTVELAEGDHDHVTFQVRPREVGLVGHTHPDQGLPGAGCSRHDRRVGRLLGRVGVRFYAFERGRMFRCN